jgi:hypothetical protein
VVDVILKLEGPMTQEETDRNVDRGTTIRVETELSAREYALLLWRHGKKVLFWDDEAREVQFAHPD